MNDPTALTCIRCQLEQPTVNFQLFSEEPRVYYDFCMTCCEAVPVETLYKQFESKNKFLTPSLVHHMRLRRPAVAKPDPKAYVPPLEVNPATRELARREAMHRSLLFFVQEFHGKYKAGWVHNDIARRLEKFMRDVEEQKSPRLMLFMPPRHGKSAIASEKFPPWALGHHPEWEIIHATHSMNLTEEFSRKARDTVLSDEYRAVFPRMRLREDTQSVTLWKTTLGGGYKAAGVGTGISGLGAHILIIDDPVKDAVDADSETIRQGHLNWFDTTSANRLAPGGGIIIIMTRWHDVDLAGRLLLIDKEMKDQGVPDEERERWEVISYPAIAEEDEWLEPDGSITVGNPQSPVARKLRGKGDALHPARYDLAALKRTRARMLRSNARFWNAQYQQKPVPDEGEFFQKSMFRYYQTPPDTTGMHVYAAWDLALGQKQANDWTVGVVGAVDCDDNLYVLDMIRGKMNSLQIAEAIMSVQKRYSPMRIGLEKGLIEMGVRPILEQTMRKEPGRWMLNFDESLKPIQDKEARARPLQGRLQLGKVFIPDNQPWAHTLMAELLRFPTGEHDDIVDALAWLVRMVGNTQPPQRPRVKPKKSWKDGLKAMVANKGNWLTA